MSTMESLLIVRRSSKQNGFGKSAQCVSVLIRDDTRLSSAYKMASELDGGDTDTVCVCIENGLALLLNGKICTCVLIKR